MGKYDVYSIANWFSNNNRKTRESTRDGNLTLNKLLYFADSFNYAIKGEKLINENPVGYANGPVYQKVYVNHRHYYAQDILSTEEKLSDDTIELLKIVNFIFGNYSATDLSDITHNQSPWKNKEEDCKLIHFNPILDFEDFNDEEKENMIALYSMYKDVDVDNMFVDKIGDNIVIYDKSTVLDEQDFAELESLPKEEDSIFIEKIDGELVYG
ncbi:Panacea domain-containing protein [Mammaliicoccus sciuri]|uniref:Panacea domain-containing protein n=1 Tax=Mammaliicoccus sciuri TaxID=1296 RepID=UPI001C4ED6A0|nr:type II toxin-antitoxin system antitoxin SocA domain-containing protein [Mammaliicoccus sciuri]